MTSLLNDVALLRRVVFCSRHLGEREVFLTVGPHPHWLVVSQSARSSFLTLTRTKTCEVSLSVSDEISD